MRSVGSQIGKRLSGLHVICPRARQELDAANQLPFLAFRPCQTGLASALESLEPRAHACGMSGSGRTRHGVERHSCRNSVAQLTKEGDADASAFAVSGERQNDQHSISSFLTGPNLKSCMPSLPTFHACGCGGHRISRPGQAGDFVSLSERHLQCPIGKRIAATIRQPLTLFGIPLKPCGRCQAISAGRFICTGATSI